MPVKAICCSIENRNSDEILFYNANQNYMEIKNIMSEIMSNSVDLVIIEHHLRLSSLHDMYPRSYSWL